MKAKVKETGEIVDVVQVPNFINCTYYWKASNGEKYESKDIELLAEWQCEKCGKIKFATEFDKPYNGVCKECAEKIDNEKWERVRIKAAISTMNGLLSNPKIYYSKYSDLADLSVKAADALVEKLKTHKNK